LENNPCVRWLKKVKLLKTESNIKNELIIIYLGLLVAVFLIVVAVVLCKFKRAKKKLNSIF